MNRLVAGSIGCFVFVLGAFTFGCAPSGVGDPCIPEIEFASNSGSAQALDLSIDVNSVQCDTRVCLQHYFQGRVSCPFGNHNVSGQTGKCAQVGDRRGYYTIGGQDNGTLCCPVIGDVDQKPIANPVQAQCSGRQAKDAVYCSCRCDVPSDPDIDRGQVTLCKCGDGFACVPLCDATHGGCALLPKGKWGSYCVKQGKLGSDFDPEKSQAAVCGGDLKP